MPYLPTIASYLHVKHDACLEGCTAARWKAQRPATVQVVHVRTSLMYRLLGVALFIFAHAPSQMVNLASPFAHAVAVMAAARIAPPVPSGPRQHHHPFLQRRGAELPHRLR